MSVFQYTGGLTPKRSKFNLSHDKKFTCDMGQLIPVMAIEAVPGDVFNLSVQSVLRFQPLVAPILHEVNVFYHSFFVPYRILWLRDNDNPDYGSEWEAFITRGVTGEYTGRPPYYVPQSLDDETVVDSSGVGIGSLWDYIGFPIDIGGSSAIPIEDWSAYLDGSNPRFPTAWPQLAYNRIYNEFYRDQNLQEPVPDYNNRILNRAWRKDYFTSALPFQQRGPAPSIPLSGALSAVFPELGTLEAIGRVFGYYNTTSSGDIQLDMPTWMQGDGTTLSLDTYLGYGSTSGLPGINPNHYYPPGSVAPSSVNVRTDDNVRLVQSGLDYLNSNVVSLEGIPTFNINDLRTAAQLQKWSERNARSGVRYTEFLRGHFRVSPTDSRLDRPEYIGGSRAPVIFSEVLQTQSSDTVTPQGNMAGHGITADFSRIGHYRVQEYGIVMTIMSVIPKATYQQGVHRQWSRFTSFDHYFPEFAHLSEQAILSREIFFVGDNNQDETIFGYTEQFNEMRYMPSMVVGEMRETFAYWHLGRIFEERPALNSEFIECVPRKDIMAVPSVPALLVWHGNIVDAVRPLPFSSEPGYLDHF